MGLMMGQGHRAPANKLEHLKRAIATGPGSKSPRGFSIRREARFDQRVDDLFRAAASDFDLLTLRSVAYLNGRYADARAGRFAIYVAEEAGRMLGYAVVTASRGKAFIADLLVLPDRADVLNALIDAAIAYSVNSAATSLRAWCVHHHPYRHALLCAGLAPAREETSISFMEYGDTSLSFVFEDARARLHIVPGDTDVV